MTIFAQIRDLGFRYDSRKPDGVQAISFDLQKGEVLGLLGPSGAGKTTLLNLLSGALPSQQGEIKFFEPVKMAYITQELTIESNQVVYDYIQSSILDLDPQQQENQIRSILSQLDLTNEIDSTLSTLSGGQRQRALIAKELVKNPNLIFLDEPFANLDCNLKMELIDNLMPLISEREITVIWTTHHIEEIMPHANRFLLINSGEMQALDTPRKLYFEPNSIFTALYFGKNNIIDPKELRLESTAELVCIRPCDIKIDEKSPLRATVISKEFNGNNLFLQVEYGLSTLWIQVNPRDKIQPQVGFSIVFIHEL